MKTNTNKLNAAIRKLGLAIRSCSELGLTMTQMSNPQIKTGDYVLHEGKLKKVVATDPSNPGRVAFEGEGVVLSLGGSEQLVLRSDG
jgi:hypothetical protein